MAALKKLCALLFDTKLWRDELRKLGRVMNVMLNYRSCNRASWQRITRAVIEQIEQKLHFNPKLLEKLSSVHWAPSHGSTKKTAADPTNEQISTQN